MGKTQQHWDNFFEKMALLVASNSYDTRKVGCVIVRGEDILAYSYNGTPRGWDNTMRDDEGGTPKHVIHAEAAAIAKCAKNGIALSGATLYCTYQPCIDCAKLIASVGIIRVVYRDSSGCDEGTDHLLKAGVTVRPSYLKYDLNKQHCTLADPVWVTQHTGL